MKRTIMFATIILVVAVLSLAVMANKSVQTTAVTNAKVQIPAVVEKENYSANVSASQVNVIVADKPPIQIVSNTTNIKRIIPKTEKTILPMPNCYTYRTTIPHKKTLFCDAEFYILTAFGIPTIRDIEE